MRFVSLLLLGSLTLLVGWSQPLLTPKGYVALTFDDGPGEHTVALLDELKRLKVRATFFVQGQHTQTHPDLVRRMVAEGHAVGNHTWSHENLVELTEEQADFQIGAGGYEISVTTGNYPTWFRPPYGARDDSLDEVVMEYGMLPITWTIDTEDWKEEKTVDDVVRKCVSAKPNDVILLHESTKTIEALPRIVRGLKRRGLQPGELDVIESRWYGYTEYGVTEWE